MSVMSAPPRPTSSANPRAPLSDNRRWVKSFAARPDLLQAPNRLVEFRQEAILQLGQTPFPTRRDEDWRYSDFTRLLTADYVLTDALSPNFEREAFEIPELDATVLVTVDGCFRPELSDCANDVTIGNIETYFEEEPHAFWLDRTLSELHAPHANAFTKLNAAFAKTGLYLAVSKNHRAAKPIHIIHLASRLSSPRMACSQVMIMLAQGAELSVTETFATLGEGEPIFRNHLVRGGLSSQARLDFHSIQDEKVEDAHLSNASFNQQKATRLDHARVDLGGMQVRNNLDVEHKAAGLETHLAGLYFASGTQRMDNQTFIDHAFPHGESNELYKGIVMDRAVTSFNGKVMVRPNAQKTNAFQQNDNLVVGKRAVANAKPQLEIFADDVKCSHGATIGQLDEEPLFYLMARGIDRGTGLGMLQRGFLLEVLDTIKLPAVRDYVERLVMQKFQA